MEKEGKIEKKKLLQLLAFDFLYHTDEERSGEEMGRCTQRKRTAFTSICYI
jgi:hypothetical protein